MNGYTTMSPEPVNDREPAQFEPIPVTVMKTIDNLCEAQEHMKRVYKLIFGEEPNTKEIPKCENLTQSVEAVSILGNEIRRACMALAERLGA